MENPLWRPLMGKKPKEEEDCLELLGMFAYAITVMRMITHPMIYVYGLYYMSNE